MKRFLLLLTAFLSFSYLFSQQLLLNEILIEPDTTDWDSTRFYQWVEIYNPGPGSVDLTGYTLSRSDGLPAITLPAWIIPDSAYLVVHLTSGTNDSLFSDSVGHFYAGDTVLFSFKTDECGLFSGLPSDTSVVDFVAWVYDTTYVPGQAHNFAVAAGKWTPNSSLFWPENLDYDYERQNLLYPGESIGRDSLSSDSDQAADWAINGGRDHFSASQGSKNAPEPPPSMSSPPPPSQLQTPLPKAKWTIMLYLYSSDNGLWNADRKAVMKNLQALGSNSDIRFVVQWILPTNNSFNSFLARRYYIEEDQTAARRGYLAASPTEVQAGGTANPGDPAQLNSFIQWSQTNYPADKYALFLGGHGDGWKGMFLHGASDRMDMPELRTALTGVQKIDVLYFYLCLMGMVEVGHQISDKADYMVASEELHAGYFPFMILLDGAGVLSNPNWSGAQFSTYAARAYDRYYQRTMPTRTISAIDLKRMSRILVPILNRMGADLESSVDDYQAHNSTADNHQILIRNARLSGEDFADRNYTDLHRFCDLLTQTANFKSGYLVNVRRTKNLLQTQGSGKIVLFEAHGSGHSNARGLSIYFPQDQEDALPSAANTFNPPYNSPFFHFPKPPGVRKYASDPNDCKPADIPCVSDFANAVNHPIVPTPNFRFPLNTRWDEFLHRYYEPVADAFADKTLIQVGGSVLFNAIGSSDSDGLLTLYNWDMAADVDVPGCNDVNADCVDAANDDPGTTAISHSVTYNNPGIYPVTLTVRDDHEFHADHTQHKEADQDGVAIIVVAIPDSIWADDDGKCGGDDEGKISAGGDGTFGPYTYLWSNGSTDSVIDNVPVGTYTVTITNTLGDSATLWVDLKDSEPMYLIPTLNAPTCQFGNDGFLEVNVTGNAGPVSYQWSTGATTSWLDLVPPGTYTLTVTDSTGCSATESFQMPAPEGCLSGEMVNNLNNGAPFLYQLPFAGYVSGTNNFQDIAKAESFQASQSGGKLKGAWVHFAIAQIDPAGAVPFEVFSANGFAGSPGNPIGNGFVPAAQIINATQMGQPVYVPFNNIPMPANNRFYIAVQLPPQGPSMPESAMGDTLALFTNSDGETVPSTAWSLKSDFSWENYSTQFGLNVSHFMIADIDYPSDPCPADGFEPNDYFLEAANLFGGGMGGWQKTLICPAGDVDWFSITVTQPGRDLRIDLKNLDADLNVELHDFNRQLARSDNGGLIPEVILYPDISVGTYFIKVYGWNDAINQQPYKLLANLLAPAPVAVNPIKAIPKAPIFRTSALPSFSFFPNPAKNQLTLVLRNLPDREAILSIRDLTGRIVFRDRILLENGNVRQAYPVSNFTAGAYLVEIRSESFIQIEKLQVIR